MAQQQLPIAGDGACMLCKTHPAGEEKLICATCVTPWHVSCLKKKPESLLRLNSWECPDCDGDSDAAAVAAPVGFGVGEDGGLVAKIRAIEADGSLTAEEKAKRRQELMTGRRSEGVDFDGDGDKDGGDWGDSDFNCSICRRLPERPVTTPCGHNFCLTCFQKWDNQGNRKCAECRGDIPRKMALQPRINATLVVAIRMAKSSRISKTSYSAAAPVVHNQNLPDKAYITSKAKKTGKANAASGKIFVTIPSDHFGPILQEHDPIRNKGVLVGESWEDRLECRQWGAHFPHVSGIAGQAKHGAQSVVLSGGYEDDEDHGEWFLYTGSGGRDLSGNKRTNKLQSFDQKFTQYNESLRRSCLEGYPVRVVRSHKEKRSSYAPSEKGCRYDGIYRIEKCWLRAGAQGYKVCRYLFVRCDNEPAPWLSDEQGDRPRLLPNIPELDHAVEVTERTKNPSWDFEEAESCWKWKRPPPRSLKPVIGNNDGPTKKRGRKLTVDQQIQKEFGCRICKKVLSLPVTTPCAHNFCKPCLEDAFSGRFMVRERATGGRSLRTKKNILKCPAPSCVFDISDFLKNLQVNRELESAIEALKQRGKDEEAAAEQEKDYEAPEDLENEELDYEEDADRAVTDSDEKNDDKEDEEFGDADIPKSVKRYRLEA